MGETLHSGTMHRDAGRGAAEKCSAFGRLGEPSEARAALPVKQAGPFRFGPGCCCCCSPAHPLPGPPCFCLQARPREPVVGQGRQRQRGEDDAKGAAAEAAAQRVQQRAARKKGGCVYCICMHGTGIRGLARTSISREFGVIFFLKEAQGEIFLLEIFRGVGKAGRAGLALEESRAGGGCPSQAV